MPAEIDLLAVLQTFLRSNLAGTVLGFFLGLLSAPLIDWIRRQQEKQHLINLFLAELKRTHLEIDSRKQAPVGKPWARIRDGILSVPGINFSGAPEYEFEVYNAKLFETEGVKLAELLRPSGRHHFWEAYGYLRDAEAARAVLKRLKKDDPDYEAYQKLFVGLIEKAADCLAKLWDTLQKERTPYQVWREAFSGRD
jgi:hypothetical protein